MLQPQTTPQERTTPSTSWLRVQIAMWGCVLTPASGCFAPNHSSEINASQGKEDYTVFKYQFSLCMDTC